MNFSFETTFFKDLTLLYSDRRFNLNYFQSYGWDFCNKLGIWTNKIKQGLNSFVLDWIEFIPSCSN